MNLINKKLLQQKYNSFGFPTGEKNQRIMDLLLRWQRAIRNSDFEKTKEKSIQGKFLQTFFEDILGYQDLTSGEEEYSLIQHPRIENNIGEPDGSLGFFTKDTKDTRVVIELKDAKTDLDKKQNREVRQTPVDQAFNYASKEDKCRWIIVSNFKEIRLYSKFRSQDNYEKFTVVDLDKESEFKRFYFLLTKENLIQKIGDSVVDILAKETNQQEQDISKEFYNKYKTARLKLLNHLIEHNTETSREILIEKTQKVLDRFIFTLFCEDTTELLPYEIVKKTYESAISSFVNSDERVWTEFKGLFNSIDKGNTRRIPAINAYNGGLFKEDVVLDRLHIYDDFWKDLLILADYDFQTDLNVNILGHIFEQSISDLEVIKEQILFQSSDGNVLKDENGNPIPLTESPILIEKKGKRKKDGIFYTPEYITKYIVDNTVGSYLEEFPDRLATIKILDPACGSGSMLNQAHTYLQTEYESRWQAKLSAKIEKGEEKLNIFEDYNPADINKGILLNNLFGVDLNNESVEITKLALWLKTARKTEPLQNLDKNIKCGNSLIDEPSIAGAKSFNWEKEFESILKKDKGFDVIIMNPPYVFGRDKFSEAEKQYYNDNYESAEYQINTFVLFIEKAIKLLKKKGRLGLIVPNSLLRLSSTSRIRDILLKETSIKKIINLTGYSFEKVNVETIILIAEKGGKTGDVEVLNIQGYQDIANANYKLINATGWISSKKKDFDIFSSESDSMLLGKIKASNSTIQDFFDVKAGLQAYEKGKGNPIQTEQDVINRPYDFNEKVDENTYPYLEGKDISRYLIKGSFSWLKYGENLAAPRTFDLFSSPRILIREITGPYPYSFISTYTSEIYLNNRSIINILSRSESENELLILLGILNSPIASYIFLKTNPKSNRELFPKVILQDLRTFPLPNSFHNLLEISTSVKAELELHKILHNIQTDVKGFISSSWGVEIKGPVELLGLNDLLAQIETKNKTIHVDQKEELYKWFRSKQSEMQKIMSEIKALENMINTTVIKAYGLTDHDINQISREENPN